MLERMRAIEWAQRHQVALYLLAIVAGLGFGVAVPGASPALEASITPVLALLLWVTFLGVPFARVGAALRDGRFVAVVLTLNFVVVPAVVWLLSRFVAHDAALLVGVLLVLLTPCIDYVIVFAGLAGGARERLLAATPLLMIVQLVLLPLYLGVMAGPDVRAAFDVRPFVEAFLFLIVLPMAAAGVTQFFASRTRAGARAWSVLDAAMVPLMVATLAIVVASQAAVVLGAGATLLGAVIVFVFFAVVMVAVGAVAGRVAGLDVPARRAVIFSGVTRNSLVVLPLALALPAPFALTPVVVVTQTLVELVVMVCLVALVPKVVPTRP